MCCILHAGEIFDIESSLSISEAIGIGTSILALCLMLIAIASAVLYLLVAKMSCCRQAFHRRTRESSPLTFTSQKPLFLQLGPVCPEMDSVVDDYMEFARHRLEFHQELGTYCVMHTCVKRTVCEECIMCV